jgi:hypothetical protein
LRRRILNQDEPTMKIVRPTNTPIEPIKPSAYASLAGIFAVGWMILSSSEDSTYFLVYMAAVAGLGSIVGVASTYSNERTWIHWAGWMLYSSVFAPFIVGLFRRFFGSFVLPTSGGFPWLISMGVYEWAATSFGVVACFYPPFKRSWLFRKVPASKFPWRPVLVFLPILVVSGLMIDHFD